MTACMYDYSSMDALMAMKIRTIFIGHSKSTVLTLMMFVAAKEPWSHHES